MAHPPGAISSPRRPTLLPPGGAALFLLLAQWLMVQRHPRGFLLMVQPFATTSSTAARGRRGASGAGSSCRPPRRRLATADSGSCLGLGLGRTGNGAVRGGGTDEGVGEIEREKTEEGDDATSTIGKIHNAKYITGLIETLQSVLDKWIVSGAMATVSRQYLDTRECLVISPPVPVRSFISFPPRPVSL